MLLMQTWLGYKHNWIGWLWTWWSWTKKDDLHLHIRTNSQTPFHKAWDPENNQYRGPRLRGGKENEAYQGERKEASTRKQLGETAQHVEYNRSRKHLRGKTSSFHRIEGVSRVDLQIIGGGPRRQRLNSGR
ncbi:hypothetical protein WAI453_000055 [Rhynchosporium graminicola]